MDNNTFSAFSNGDCIGDYALYMGLDIEVFEDFLRNEDIYASDMVRISNTREDRYYFYKVYNKDTEDRCVEVYFNPDGIIYDIQVMSW